MKTLREYIDLVDGKVNEGIFDRFKKQPEQYSPEHLECVNRVNELQEKIYNTYAQVWEFNNVKHSLLLQQLITKILHDAKSKINTVMATASPYQERIANVEQIASNAIASLNKYPIPNWEPDEDWIKAHSDDDDNDDEF